jgi:L-amino acid N-acyltransferase YncA
MQAISRSVRSACAHDAAACVAIYRPYVENTAISWEIEVPSVDEMASRIASAQKAHEWLVLEHDGQVIGFAYGHPLHCVPSYQWSVETGIYVSGDHRRAGGDRTLYVEVLRRLTDRGYRRVFARITQPNKASNAFHRSFGFRDATSTGASNGNTAAGTTSHGCNSVCTAPPTRMDRLAQSPDRKTHRGTRLAT